MRNQSSGFSCPTCQEPLVTVSARTPYAFAFGCSSGHEVSLAALFERQSAALKDCFEAMITVWEKSIRQMTESAGIAEKGGSPDLAKRFLNRVATLEARVHLFRDTFVKSDLHP